MSVVDLESTHDALLRRRQLQRRITGAATQPEDRQYEVFSVAGPQDHYSQHATMKAALAQANETATRYPGTVLSCWSPTRAHVYQAVRHVGAKELSVLHGAQDGGPVDTTRPARARYGAFDTPEELVQELVQYIATTAALNALAEAVRINLTDLLTKGVYDPQTAVKAFIPVADQAVRRYRDQYGGTGQEQYPQDIRRLTAERLLQLYEQEARLEPERFVDQYVQKQEQASGQQQQTIQLPGGGDGTTVVINIHTAEAEEQGG